MTKPWKKVWLTVKVEVVCIKHRNKKKHRCDWYGGYDR